MNEIPPIFFILGGLLALFFLWRITQPTSDLKAPAEPSAVSDYVTQLVGREAGTFRLNPPHDGGCRHGYCYACANKVGVLDTNDPTLPRDDTYWFCSSYCYNRMLNGYVPLEFRGEYTATYYYVDQDDLDQQKRNARIKADYHYEMQKKFLLAAAPRLLNVLEQIEREEPARVAKLEEEKRASYKHPDPPDHWKPLYDPPVIRTIKKPTSDRCLKCGTLEKSARPVFVQDTPFWYCSDSCSFKATEDFVPERWKSVDDNPEWKRYFDALSERNMLPSHEELWKQYEPHYSAAYANARNVLEERLRAEARKQEAEEAEKEAEMQNRQWETDFEAAEKEHQKFLEAEAYEQALIFKPIPDHLRIHTGIIAKTGWGKTQLLQSLILGELQKRDPPSLIVLDSTGQMVDLIQHLAVFNDRLRDRILIIDPAHSPSLNMFDLSTPRFETYTREQKEDIQNEIVGLFNYVFSSEDYKLTGQMGIGFAYAVRLILSRPNSTMRDLRRLLEEDCRRCDDSAYAPDIANLDEDAQDFFRSHFYSDELKKTRAAIARRLQLMLSIPAFARMFITSRNALDLYGETQDKHSIILVNTNERLLKEGGYILFGRYIVARTMAAVLERASIPREQRTITHLIIDEGSPYMDETFDTLLTRVRQYGLKVTIAFQHFQQLTDKLKNSVAGQTSVKYAGGLSYQDSRFLANDMRCEPDFHDGSSTN